MREYKEESFTSLIDNIAKNILTIEMREKETLAWKFMQETKLLPSEIELVSRFEGNEQRFYYQKKSEYPDPSLRAKEVDSYEKDLLSLAASHDFGLIPGIAVTNLFKVIEKHFVRKGDSCE